MKGVIIEGIDCAGKTTLAKNLKFHLKQFGGYDVKELEHKQHISQFDRYLHEYTFQKHVIFDRSHISEAVFGQFLRKETPFSLEEFDILNKIVNLKFIIVLAEPTYPDFINRLSQSQKYQVITQEQYDEITWLFKVALKDVKHFLYRSESLDILDATTNEIIKKLGSV